jgi:hypothetical protein
MYKKIRRWLCERFELHADSYYMYYDNKNAESKCRYCGKEIIRPLSSYKWQIKVHRDGGQKNV